MGLELAEVMMDIENRFDIVFSEDLEWSKVITVSDLVNLTYDIARINDPNIQYDLVESFVTASIETTYGGWFRKMEVQLDTKLKLL